MMTANEIKEKLEANKELKKSLEEKENKLANEYHELIMNEIYKKRDTEDVAEKEKIQEKLDSLRIAKETELKEIHNQINIINLEDKIYANNYKHVVVAAAIPVIVEVMSKYKGKRCGEATSEKIRKELKEKTGHYISLDRYNSSDGITSNAIRISIALNIAIGNYVDVYSNNPILKNNVIQNITVDDLLNKYEYYEDVTAKVTEIKNCYKHLQIIAQQLQDVTSEFRDMIGEMNIDRPYFHKSTVRVNILD